MQKGKAEKKQEGGIRRKMIWILGSIAVLVAAIIILFQIPYSPTRNEFLRDVHRHTEQAAINTQSGIFTEQNIEHLPELIQNHFRAANWIGQPISSAARAFMPSVPLYQSIDSPPLILDYTVYVFAHPARLAYMTTSMFGLPFEAYDSTQEGTGFMRGVIGRILTLFNETGPEMDQGQLMTWLGEAPLLPSIFLSQYIDWESIDANHVRATLAYRGITGSGIFAFDDNGFMQSFHTHDKPRVETDGSIEFPALSHEFDEWIRNENGMYIPYSVRAIWHLYDGDLIYFASRGFEVEFRY